MVEFLKQRKEEITLSMYQQKESKSEYALEQIWFYYFVVVDNFYSSCHSFFDTTFFF